MAGPWTTSLDMLVVKITVCLCLFICGSVLKLQAHIVFLLCFALFPTNLLLLFLKHNLCIYIIESVIRINDNYYGFP